MSVERVSHIGLCVADLEASLHFYRDALGFRERSRLDVAGEHAARLLQVADASLRAVYLERDGLRLELLHFEAQEPADDPTLRPMNQPGLTHLSLRVTGMAPLLERIVVAGGRVLEETRILFPAATTTALFVTDPDGTRIELVEAPGDVEKLPGE